MSRTAFRFLVVCLMAVALVRPAVAAGCTDKAKCMQCLLPDALINQSLVLTLYAGDACTWPGVSCDSRGNVVSVVVKHQVKNFFPQCVPDTVTSLSIAGLGLLVFTTWLGHASLQTLDISGNRYACVISGQSGTKVPDACFGLIGQFPALQTVTTNVMSAVGFNVTFQDLPNLLTVIADSGTSVGQLYVRNCPNLISVRLRGLGGYFVVTDQRYAAAAPTPVMGGQSVAASVIQGGTSLTTVSCIDCPLLAAAFSCATLKSLTLTGANFGTAVASNVALAQFSDTLVTGAPQLLYLPGLLISSAAALTSINVTSSKLGCFDFDLPSLAVMCVAMNNISGWITSSRPPSSSVLNRTCPFWGPSQHNWQSSVVLRQLVANDNRLSIVDKSSVYSTLDFINLANNQLAAVFFCNQPCSYADVSNNPTLQGDVCTLRSQLPAAAFVNSTRSCCGGAVGSAIEFSSAIGGQSSVQCVCSSPLTPPDDYSNCTAAATYTTATDKCTAQASFYDPAQNPSTSDKPIFRDAVFTTRKRADGTYDLVMSNVTLSSDSFPVFVPSGRFVVGVDALLTRDALAYTLASSSNFAFRFAFNNGAPDAWQPANKWIATLNPATCRMEYAYRIDPANLVNDSFVTVTRSGNTYTVVVDVTFMEALPVLLSNNTFVHYDARRVTYTLQFTIAPPVLPMCGALLRGNLDATNASGVRLLIVNYASVGVSNLSATPVNQQPSGFFSQCVPYNPPPSLQGVACQGGALTSALTASATITLRGTSASGLPVTCSYPFAAQIQPPVSVVTPQTPGGGTPTTTVPRGSFQGTCGSNPANADATVIYVIAGSVTVIITITQPVTGLSVVVTDQPNMFNLQQVYDALRGETTVSFNPIAALQFYPWMYTESSVVLSVKSAASSRRQTSSANPDQYSLTLSTAVTQSAASALTTAAPPTAAPPTTTSSPPTTTPPTTSPITRAPTGAPTTATSTTGAPTTTRTPATTGAPATTTNAPPTTTAAPTTTTSTATTTARAPTTTNASTTVPATTTGAAATTTAPTVRNASAPTNTSTTVAPTADANVTNSTTAANATLGPLPTAINGQQPTTTQSPLQTVMDGPSPTTTPAPPPNGRSKVSTAPSLGGRGTSIVVALLCVVSIFHV